MLNRCRTVLLFLVFCCACQAGLCQDAKDSVMASFETMSSFLNGNWEGKGAFANGRPIEAAASFQYDTVYHTLTYRHSDKAPGQWKNLTLINVLKDQHKIVALYNDKWSGARIFYSELLQLDKWSLVRQTSKMSERFVFTLINERQFRLEWEVKKEGGEWKLGDSLVFSRA